MSFVELTEKAKARLKIEEKVPSDCVISQSVEPFPIAEVAQAYVKNNNNNNKEPLFFLSFYLINLLIY